MTQSALTAQNVALQEFLDDLLTEEESPQAESVEVDGSELSDSEAITPPVEEPVQTTVSTEAVGDTMQMATEDPDAGRIPIIPSWAAGPFQAMVFKVGDLALAIPLAELSGVLEWKPSLASLRSGEGLYRGDYSHADSLVKLIDTAQFVLPASHPLARQTTETLTQASRIILIDNGNLGLLANEVFELVTISPDRVNWRSKQTRRQWLAGTMLEELIILLDPRTTVQLLNKALAAAD